MKVVILCGGLGTRLREETEYRPKPMVDVGGKPIDEDTFMMTYGDGLADLNIRAVVDESGKKQPERQGDFIDLFPAHERVKR